MTRIKCNKKGCNKMATVEHYDFECDYLQPGRDMTDWYRTGGVAYCKKHEAEL